MNEQWIEVVAFVKRWYPIVLGSLTAVGTSLVIGYAVYTKIKVVVDPILTKMNLFRDKDDELAEQASVLELIKIDTMKADLLYKIQNDTVSPELTLIYQTQFDKLDAITDKVVEVTEKVSDNKYIG
jgi:hypothetical protein